MTRPCFLVIDREHAGSISTRKLVIETAKLNVITAYSGAEAIEMFERFPNVDGIVMDARIADVPCGALIKRLREIKAGVPVVVIGSPRAVHCEAADEFLEAFEPAKLLRLLQGMVPEAQRVADREQAELPTDA